MSTNKNILPTLAPSTTSKYLTVNQIADQFDSSSLFLSYEVITADPATPVTNRAYLLNFGATSGRIRYYYLNSATNLLIPIDIPTVVGDVFKEYRRSGTTWILDRSFVVVGGAIDASVFQPGLNYVSSATSIALTFTGTLNLDGSLYPSPVLLTSGLHIFNKVGADLYGL